MVKVCARLSECRLVGNDVDYIATSFEGDKKFIYPHPLNEQKSDLSCLLNHLLEVDYDPRYHDRGCIRECTNQCTNECKVYNEDCIKECYLDCDQGCVEGSESTSGDLYVIADNMKFATDSQCS